jgi:hypothetical protein
MAGVGKTALALHWAHSVADSFPDGQLFVNLNGFGPAGAPMTHMEAVSRLLEAMQVPSARLPSTVDGRIGLYRTLLCERRVLLVLDNAKDADQVRPLVPGSGGCFVVITSRTALTGLVALEDAHALTLSVLSESDARQMVAKRIGSTRAAADGVATDHLIGASGRLPLALAIATALVATRAGHSLAAIAAELAKAGDRLGALNAGEPMTNLSAVFNCSYRALTARAARLFAC